MHECGGKIQVNFILSPYAILPCHMVNIKKKNTAAEYME